MKIAEACGCRGRQCDWRGKRRGLGMRHVRVWEWAGGSGVPHVHAVPLPGTFAGRYCRGGLESGKLDARLDCVCAAPEGSAAEAGNGNGSSGRWIWACFYGADNEWHGLNKGVETVGVPRPPGAADRDET